MKCPRCAREKTRVLNSRQRGSRRVRRRECEECEHVFATTEVLGVVSDALPLLTPLVMKKSGETEEYSRQKLTQSVSVALRKATRDDDWLAGLIDEIENDIAADIGGHMRTKDLGERVMAALRRRDAVAYLRYASAHLEMTSPGDFQCLLDELRSVAAGESDD